ncbi:MAG: hypothetical protein RLZ25_981 [Pseudomonadota bacterium]|jgi:hypothetical protein
MFKLSARTAALSIAAATLTGMSSLASAHTTVFTTVPAYLGSGSMNYLQIGHGCLEESTGERLPIIAQSVALPIFSPTIVFKDVATGNIITSNGNLNDFTAADHTGAITPLQSVGDLIRPVIPQAGWTQTTINYDSNIESRVLGWYSKTPANSFKLPGTSAYTEQPFKVGVINALSTSCARSLQVKIAIADVCKLNKWPVTKENAAADLWIPNTTAKFPYGNVDAVGTPVDAGNPAAGSKPLTGYPATLTLWRDQLGTNPGAAPSGTGGASSAKANPLPANCGKGYDVIVYPSNTDVDLNLPLVWGKRAR